MNKKILVFLLVVIGLGGIVWWQSNPNGGSPEERFARAIQLMEGLQSRAIPVQFTDDQTELLEGVYQDSIVRLPNIQGFRNTDKAKLADTLRSNGFSGTGVNNNLNVLGESIMTLSLQRTDDFNANINSHISDLGSVDQALKDEVKKLAQSVNTLTNDIRLTLLYMSWYEIIRPTLCTTNDPNNDIYINGQVLFRYVTNNTKTDTCDITGGVRQYKCLNGQYIADSAHTSLTTCPDGCSNGACVQSNQSGFEIIGASTATVGTPISLRVKAIGADGTANTSYTGTFFLIIAGDDEAEFPAGAHSIPSGQSDITISGITFSKAGTMTLTVRDQNNLEVSKTITVSAAGTTTSTTGTTASTTTTTATSSGTATSGTSTTTTTTSGTTTTGTIAPSCTGTLPTNSTILADVGATSRAWTYDSSLTGPYQNCSFKCATGYSYVGSSCVAPTIGTTGTTGTLTTSTTSGGTLSTTGTTTTTTSGATSGTATSGTVTTTSGSTTSSTGTTTNGTTTSGTTTISTGITGPVSITDIKDCWFGDTTRRITLADLIGYQASPSTSSGLIYTDEVLLYGAATPIANEQATNSFSYEESEWIAGEDIVTTSTQLTNFFAFRTNSPGTRTWNIPTTGIKFYGCFSRDDRPTTW